MIPIDRIALNTMAALFPTREVVPIIRRPDLGTRHHALHDAATAISKAAVSYQPSAVSKGRLWKILPERKLAGE